MHPAWVLLTRRAPVGALLPMQLGASLDEPTPCGYTPLSVAICWEQQEAARLLLSLGADPNQASRPPPSACCACSMALVSKGAAAGTAPAPRACRPPCGGHAAATLRVCPSPQVLPPHLNGGYYQMWSENYSSEEARRMLPVLGRGRHSGLVQLWPAGRLSCHASDGLPAVDTVPAVCNFGWRWAPLSKTLPVVLAQAHTLLGIAASRLDWREFVELLLQASPARGDCAAVGCHLCPQLGCVLVAMQSMSQGVQLVLANAARPSSSAAGRC